MVRPSFVLSQNRLEFSTKSSNSRVVEIMTPDIIIRNAYASHPAFQVHLVDNHAVSVSFTAEKWYDNGYKPVLVLATSSSTEPSVRVPLDIVAE